MKLFAFLAAVEATVWIHPEVIAANRALGIPTESVPGVCLFQCMGDLIREDIRCEAKYGFGTPEYELCFSDAETNLESCLRADGCIAVDGSCSKICIPQMEEGITKCESDLEGGLLTELQFVQCINKISVRIKMIQTPRMIIYIVHDIKLINQILTIQYFRWSFRNALTYAHVTKIGVTAIHQVHVMLVHLMLSAIQNRFNYDYFA